MSGCRLPAGLSSRKDGWCECLEEQQGCQAPESDGAEGRLELRLKRDGPQHPGKPLEGSEKGRNLRWIFISFRYLCINFKVFYLSEVATECYISCRCIKW